jgi:hypothetical protein
MDDLAYFRKTLACPAFERCEPRLPIVRTRMRRIDDTLRINDTLLVAL